ncbi:MAG: cell envelope integrity protein CreD [Gammaproteobacteria bacterium]|nr:cell envelope integrity protein CreD [Gammaproteobacteria bacterium]MDH5732127.1 cell envelope integrity protein CreD [Gammaproteobacteria bacterium]
MKKSNSQKIGLALGLCLGFLIPFSNINGIADERSSGDSTSIDSAKTIDTTQKNIIGPILVLPYMQISRDQVWDETQNQFVEDWITQEDKLYILPEELEINGETISAHRVQGLNRIPVHNAHVKIKGTFNNQQSLQLAHDNKQLQWQEAYLTVLVTNSNEVQAQPKLTWNNNQIQLAPNKYLSDKSIQAVVGEINQHQQTRYTFNIDIQLKS